jgi:GGDEF domain-containing protein
MSQCTAKSKQSGQRCKRAAVVGRTVCSIHGGKTPTGVSAPNFKTGRHSKYLPARLGERYQAALADQDSLNLAAEIALVDARIGDVLGRVDTGESGRAWTRLKQAYSALQKAKRMDQTEEADELLLELGSLIGKGVADYAAWDEIGSYVEQRRRLVESERKRLVDMQQTVTIEQVMIVLAAISDVVRRHVDDSATLARISAELNRIVDSGSVAAD